MAEWKLFDGDTPHVATLDFHRDRPRAPHLEQAVHRPRLLRAAELVGVAAGLLRRAGEPVTVSDVGCGDGGLLSLVQDTVDEAWGYDFAPANAAGWPERRVRAEAFDVFGVDRDHIRFGTVTVVTEVLEHIADPHGAVTWIAGRSRYLVASSPWNEVPDSHDECHAWAWDMPGYAALLAGGGWRLLRHEQVDQFQLALGWRP